MGDACHPMTLHGAGCGQRAGGFVWYCRGVLSTAVWTMSPPRSGVSRRESRVPQGCRRRRTAASSCAKNRSRLGIRLRCLERGASGGACLMAEPHDGYAPDPKFLDAFPDVSGNDINGLGETNPRPASRFSGIRRRNSRSNCRTRSSIITACRRSSVDLFAQGTARSPPGGACA